MASVAVASASADATVSHDKAIVPICFGSDNNYIPYISVAIQSILEHASSERHYKFFVLHTEISIKNKELIKKQIDSFTSSILSDSVNGLHCSVEFIDISEYIKDYTIKHFRWPPSAYYKLIVPYIFALQEYPELIFFDGDIICLEDPANLLDNEIDEHYIIKAVRSARGPLFSNLGARLFWKPYTKKLGIKNVCDYFNSGVLVFTKKFRETVPLKQLLELSCSHQFEYADQCVLNIICNGKINFLNLRWNVTQDGSNKITKKFKTEHYAAQKNPAVLHYAFDKPWLVPHITQRTKHFWVYAAKTPFIQELINSVPACSTIPISLKNYIKYNFIGVWYSFKNMLKRQFFN